MTIKEKFEQLSKDKECFRKETSREERNLIQKRIDNLEDEILKVVTVGKCYKLNDQQYLVNTDDDLLEVVEMVKDQ